MIDKILQNTRLTEVDNTWVLFSSDGEYVRLLSATSRDDAEQQIAEMLFIRNMNKLISQQGTTRWSQTPFLRLFSLSPARARRTTRMQRQKAT